MLNEVEGLHVVEANLFENAILLFIPHADHRDFFLVAHPLPPRQTARPPPIAAEEAQGRGRGLPMPRQSLRADFEGLGMDKGEVGRGGQCRRMLVAPPGQ